MEIRNKESVTNENIDAYAEALSDLPVSDDKADQTKAGADDYAYVRKRFGTTI
jgi:hypothetical protein